MTFLSHKEQKAVVDAIMRAEKNTSGELRVHIDRLCQNEEVLDRAAWVFNELGMTHTERRNGVLIYIAADSHKFAIIGDAGINAIVPENFWDQAKEAMAKAFSEGRIAEGIVAAIETIGIQLREHFPWQTDDVDELPNEISYGEVDEVDNSISYGADMRKGLLRRLFGKRNKQGQQ